LIALIRPRTDIIYLTIQGFILNLEFMHCFLYASGHWTNGGNFFWNEYILNYIIATYSKPQVINLTFLFWIPQELC